MTLSKMDELRELLDSAPLASLFKLDIEYQNLIKDAPAQSEELKELKMRHQMIIDEIKNRYDDYLVSQAEE